MQLAVITGVALVAAECLTSLGDIRRVLRALTWGGAFCGVVAALQFWISLDLVAVPEELPGFSINFDNPAIVARAALNRVAGTSILSIELGVVAGMLLPLAVYLAMLRQGPDAAASGGRRSLLIGLAIPAVRVAVGDHLGRALLRGARGSDAAAAAAGRAVRGSPRDRRGVHVGARRDRHAHVVLRSRHQRRLGGGTGVRLPGGGAARESGAMVRPRRRDLHARQPYVHTRQPVPEDGDRTRLLRGRRAARLFPGAADLRLSSPGGAARTPSSDCCCAALAGAALAAAVCSFTFDSLSFPMFSNVYALVIGLIGAAWRLAPGPPQAERGASIVPWFHA